MSIGLQYLSSFHNYFNGFFKPSFKHGLKHGQKVLKIRLLSSISNSNVVTDKSGERKSDEDVKLDADLVAHIERLSLVNFNNEEGIKRLEEHIKSANDLHKIDVSGVEPLMTVLEDRSLYLHEDKACVENSRDDILRNAQLTEEEYYIAPPGNIPLNQDDRWEKLSRTESKS